MRKKVFQNALVTLATLWAGIGSAVLSGASPDIAEQFQVSSVVAELANGMFVFGFAMGPQVFGPLSEVLGRKWPLTLGIFLGSMFSIQTAGASNLATVMLGRFFGGVFGAAPYAIGGGWFHDVYDALHVQAGVAFFAVATAGGPALGPVIGAGLASTSTTYGWRWTEWFMTAFGLLITCLLAIFMDESYAPAILKREAMQLRRSTGNWAWHSELDTVTLTPRDIILRYVLRPAKMLFTEPSECTEDNPDTSASHYNNLHVFRLRAALHANGGFANHLRRDAWHEPLCFDPSIHLRLHRYPLRRRIYHPRYEAVCTQVG